MWCNAGALYLEDCPVQRFIPIYLVVGGAFALYENLSGLVQSICQVKDPDKERTVLGIFCKASESLVGCFVVIWFICGQFNTISRPRTFCPSFCLLLLVYC